MNTLFKEFKQWYEKVEKFSDPTRNMLTQHSIEDTAPFKISIPRLHYICGLVSQEVYKPPEQRLRSISNFSIDEGINYERTVVYKTQLEFEDIFIIGVRGTANSIVDLATDLLVASGSENFSFRKNAQVKLVQDIIISLSSEGYSVFQSFITGHSLGGLITAYCLEAIPDITGVGFNTGSSPLQVKIQQPFTQTSQILSNRNQNMRFINYHMENDLISSSSVELFIDTIILKPRPAPNSANEAHSLGFLLKSTSPNPFLFEF